MRMHQSAGNNLHFLLTFHFMISLSFLKKSALGSVEGSEQSVCARKPCVRVHFVLVKGCAESTYLYSSRAAACPSLSSVMASVRPGKTAEPYPCHLPGATVKHVKDESSSRTKLQAVS